VNNAALSIAEFLNQPIRIWMVVSIFVVARLVMLLARIRRERSHQKIVVEGMAARSEDKVKRAIYLPKTMRRKNTDAL